MKIVSSSFKGDNCEPILALPERQASCQGELTYKLAIIYSAGHVLSRVRVDSGGAEGGKWIRCLPERACMIRRVYIQFIAPLTIYLRRSFPRHVRSLSVTYRIFFAVFLPSQFQRRILGCVRSTNFKSSPDGPLFVIRFYYPVQDYKESDAQKLLCLIGSAKRSWPLQSWLKSETPTDLLCVTAFLKMRG